MSVHEVRNGDVTLVVHDAGDPALPPAVIAHGVGSSPRFIREAFAAPLAALGCRLVAYDLRGHGASTPLTDPADHRFELQVDDLTVVARHVGASLIGGVSLGGHAAAAVAAGGHVDLDGLIVCLPAWTGRARAGEGPHALVAAEIRSVGVDAMLRRVRTDDTVVPWLRELLDRDWRTHPADSLAAALISLDGGDAPTGDGLSRIEVPTGVVGWPDDPGHPLEVALAWTAAMRNAELVTMSLDGMADGKTAMGAAAVRALSRTSFAGPRGS